MRDPNGFSETLARLEGIVGAGRLGTPQRLATHRPNTFRMKPPDFEDGKAERASCRSGPPRDAPLCFPPIGLSLRRYRPPFRVAVESRDDRPAWMRGRDTDAGIRASAGPWRLNGGWWEEQKEWRWEEWDVELTVGGLYRLANHRHQNWWMLGMYD